MELRNSNVKIAFQKHCSLFTQLKSFIIRLAGLIDIVIIRESGVEEEEEEKIRNRHVTADTNCTQQMHTDTHSRRVG